MEMDVVGKELEQAVTGSGATKYAGVAAVSVGVAAVIGGVATIANNI